MREGEKEGGVAAIVAKKKKKKSENPKRECDEGKENKLGNEERYER